MYPCIPDGTHSGVPSSETVGGGERVTTRRYFTVASPLLCRREAHVQVSVLTCSVSISPQVPRQISGEVEAGESVLSVTSCRAHSADTMAAHMSKAVGRSAVRVPLLHGWNRGYLSSFHPDLDPFT